MRILGGGNMRDAAVEAEIYLPSPISGEQLIEPL
jgi:hypothetical protein